MSRRHRKFEALRWPLADAAGCLRFGSKARVCIDADLKGRGWAYPPCVYTDDPLHDCPRDGDCLRGGCAYRFLPPVEAAALGPGDAVTFEGDGGRIVRGTVQVVDRYPAASGMQPTFDAMGEDGVLYKHCPLSSIVEAG